MESSAAANLVPRRELVRLTMAKLVGNVALRWIPFFLFVLEDAFDATTSQLTLVLGLGEMAGLATVLVGGRLDEGHERRFLVVAMILLSGSGIVALGGSLFTFAIAFVLVIAGASLVTVSGHTWLSHRVPFERRGRAIGVFEMSWALALLVGAPVIALVIRWFGWRGPFVVVSIAAAVMALVISRLPDGGRLPTPDQTKLADTDPVAGAHYGSSANRFGLSRRAIVVVAMSAAIAMAGLSTIVIVGTWLEDTFAVSTGQVGLTAMLFGFAEIVASGASARLSDDLGKARTTGLALVAVLVGLVVMMVADTSFVLALIGLGFFFVGFEYAVVTSFSLVSEAAPMARGRVLATNNAVSTLTRGSGTVLAGYLYDRFGINGPTSLSLAAAVVAIVLLWWGSETRRPDQRAQGQLPALDPR